MDHPGDRKNHLSLGASHENCTLSAICVPIRIPKYGYAVTAWIQLADLCSFLLFLLFLLLFFKLLHMSVLFTAVLCCLLQVSAVFSELYCCLLIIFCYYFIFLLCHCTTNFISICVPIFSYPYPYLWDLV